LGVYKFEQNPFKDTVQRDQRGLKNSTTNRAAEKTFFKIHRDFQKSVLALFLVKVCRSCSSADFFVQVVFSSGVPISEVLIICKVENEHAIRKMNEYRCRQGHGQGRPPRGTPRTGT
jgi:hypothetical protein